MKNDLNEIPVGDEQESDSELDNILDTNPEFQHENFQIRMHDDLNVSLYRKEKVEIRIGAGYGKGSGTPTGTYKDKWIWKGFYTGFNGAFWKMVDYLALEKKDVTELKQLIKEMKSIGESFGKQTLAMIEDRAYEKALVTLKIQKSGAPIDPNAPKVIKLTKKGIPMKPRGRKAGMTYGKRRK